MVPISRTIEFWRASQHRQTGLEKDPLLYFARRSYNWWCWGSVGPTRSRYAEWSCDILKARRRGEWGASHGLDPRSFFFFRRAPSYNSIRMARSLVDPALITRPPFSHARTLLLLDSTVELAALLRREKAPLGHSVRVLFIRATHAPNQVADWRGV